MGGREAFRVLAGVVLLAGLGGSAAAGQGARQVLGVLSVQGDVWTQEVADGAHEAAVRGGGTPLLESTRIRTGKDAAALLTLGQEGVVGLRGDSRAEVGVRASGTHIGLAAGEALVRIPTGSGLTLTTSTATVHDDGLQPVSTGSARPNEASIRIMPDGRMLVRVETGRLRVESRQGGTTLVAAGEQTLLGQDGVPHVVAASTAAGTAAPAAPTAAADTAAGGVGIFSSDAMVAGLASVAVVAGTLGGLAGAGELGNGDDGNDDSSSSAGQGSPFKPGKGNNGNHGNGNNGNGNGNGGGH